MITKNIYSLVRLLACSAWVMFSMHAFSQNQSKVDSLLNRLKTAKEDTNKVNILYQLSEEYAAEDILKYAEPALRLAEKLNYKKGIANASSNIGYGYRQKDISKCLRYYYKSLKIWKEINDKSEIAYTLNNIGVIYAYQGNIPKCLEYYYRSLKIQEEINDKEGIANSLNNIGFLYREQGDLQKALECFNKSLKIHIVKDKKTTAHSLNGIGYVYKDQGNLKKALDYFDKSLKIHEEINDKATIAKSLNNIGVVYRDQGDFQKALDCFNKSLKIQEEINDNEITVNSFDGIGGIYFKLKKYRQAEDYYSRSLRLSRELNYPIKIRNASRGLSNIYEAQGKYKDAYEMHVLFKQMSDSIMNEETHRSSVKKQMQYEFEKQEQQIKFEHEKEKAILLLENIRNRYVIYGVSGIGLLMVVISVLFILQQKLKAKRKAIELEQKLLRSQMNPHFIFNSLNAIQNFIYKNNSKESAKYLASFAKLMRMILENSREEYVSLEKEISTLEHYLGLQRLRFQNKFDFLFTVDPGIDPAGTAIPPMLAQPFIENAIEHGLKHKETKGHIDIRFTKLNDSTILFEVEDNGIGRKNAEKLKNVSLNEHKSMATDITKERIEILNKKHTAKIKLDIVDIQKDGNDCGTKVVFSLPFKILT